MWGKFLTRILVACPRYPRDLLLGRRKALAGVDLAPSSSS